MTKLPNPPKNFNELTVDDLEYLRIKQLFTFNPLEFRNRARQIKMLEEALGLYEIAKEDNK
jgi:hypothetical protein